MRYDGVILSHVELYEFAFGILDVCLDDWCAKRYVLVQNQKSFTLLV